uniref:Proliferating cell nuclear antigen n=1 Tax=Strongyloides papillosus TaxID=174720 RepID=A0A0N5C2A7_STREA
MNAHDLFDEFHEEQENIRMEEESCSNPIKEPHSAVLGREVPCALNSQHLGDMDSKDLVCKGAKYAVSKNLAFLCKIIQNLSTLGSTLLFVPEKDQLSACIYNASTCMFSKTVFKRDFFCEVDSSCLTTPNAGCCISSEAALNVFKISPELLDDIKYMVIDTDPSKDFINVMLFGPGSVSELIKINQLAIRCQLADDSRSRAGEIFQIVGHVDVWDGFLKRSNKTASAIKLHFKRDRLIVTPGRQKPGTGPSFSCEISAQSFMKYDIDEEFFLTFDYNEFAIACNIVSRISKEFVLECVGGDAPLRMSLYQPGIVDFEIFLPCELEEC